MKRPDYESIIKRLAFAHRKMAFVTGPRQVGKTTLAKTLLAETSGPSQYGNWDDPSFRRQWVKDPKHLLQVSVGEHGLLVLDEIHKALRWKNTIKGIYDTRSEEMDILVTGSAKLDVFRRDGDSLLGRYFLFRLHPFSMGEILGQNPLLTNLEHELTKKQKDRSTLLHQLLEFSGFPEPFLKKDPTFLNLWRKTRLERLIREDLRDLTRIHEFSLMEALASLLPERVASTLSLTSLREDLEISHPTLKRWMQWLEQVFYVYQLHPYSKNLLRSLKKETKPYLWDWSEVEESSARFENLVAGHFLKACHYATDTGQGKYDLFYVRDKEKREVDFLIVKDKKPWLLAECKLNSEAISPHLLYYAERLKPAIVCQLVLKPNLHEKFALKEGGTGYLVSADKFLALLP